MRSTQRSWLSSGARRWSISTQACLKPGSPGGSSRRRPTTCTSARERRRSEEHTSELQSRSDLVCRLLLEKKKKKRAQESEWQQDSDVHWAPNSTTLRRSSETTGWSPRTSRAAAQDVATVHWRTKSDAYRA